jgi:hypothetical protein
MSSTQRRPCRTVGGGPRNLMRLFFHPEGIRPLVTNWAAVGPLIWRRAQREAEMLGGQEMKAVLADLAPHQALRCSGPRRTPRLYRCFRST